MMELFGDDDGGDDELRTSVYHSNLAPTGAKLRQRAFRSRVVPNFGSRSRVVPNFQSHSLQDSFGSHSRVVWGSEDLGVVGDVAS